jgi:DNA invertase Pin-like site-specific DNA recombinase
MSIHARRTLGYVRVSGLEQSKSGTSLEGQREELRRYCRAHALPAPRLFVEVASAGREKLAERVELRALLAEARSGDLVLVCKVDRWSRDIVWCVQSVRELVARGVGWTAIGEGIDAADPNGDRTLGLMAWVADQERARIRERTVGRRKELRDQGCYVEGRVPVGYERVERRLRVLEDEAPIVKLIFDRCIAGDPLSAIRDRLLDEHPARSRWDKASLRKIIRTRTYLGEVRGADGVWRPGHPAIVDRATFERAQRALEGRRLGGGGRTSEQARTATWLLRGVATCATCGARMGAAYSTTKGGYYACRSRLAGRGCQAPYVDVELSDHLAADLVVARLAELSEELEAPPPVTDGVAPDFDGRRARLTAKRERLIELASDGTITRDDLRGKLGAVDAQLERLELERADEERAAAFRRPSARAAVLRTVDGLARAWKRASVAARRRILLDLAESVQLGADGPKIAWLPPEELRKELGGDHLS